MSGLRDTVSATAFAIGYQVRGLFSPVVIAKDARGKHKHRGGAARPGSLTPATDPAAASLGSNESELSGSDDDDVSDTASEIADAARAAKADLAAIKARRDDMKLVLVINDSLKMNKGKIAAQASHATLACYETLAKSNPQLVTEWKRQGQPKVVCRCANTEELNDLARKATALNLCARTITDAGRTQVAPGSRTVCGIGPGPVKLINQVTGKLRLL